MSRTGIRGESFGIGGATEALMPFRVLSRQVNPFRRERKVDGSIFVVARAVDPVQVAFMD
jgi:hypothetical protein